MSPNQWRLAGVIISGLGVVTVLSWGNWWLLLSIAGVTCSLYPEVRRSKP